MTDPKTVTVQERLREALIRSGRAAGALLADNVSDDFLMLVPGEIEARIAALQSERASMEGEIERLREAVEPLANLYGVNMNDPLRKWLTMAQLQAAVDTLNPTGKAE
jgi:hypothetical protein